MKLSSEIRFKGQFVSDHLEGDCEVVYPNGDIYYGMMAFGKKNGKGTLKITKKNIVLNGYWKNDVFTERE